MLKTVQEVSKNLVVAPTVLGAGWAAEKRAKLVFAYFHICTFKYFQNSAVVEGKSNFKLTENNIVVQKGFGRGLGSFLFASLSVNKPIQKKGQLAVVYLLKSRVFVLFKPVANFGAGYAIVGLLKHVNHLRIAKVECEPYATEYIVVFHGDFL